VKENELKSGQLDELLAYFGLSRKGGKIIKAIEYADATGEVRRKAIVDYGIGGTKKVDESVYNLDKKAGRVEPTLEDLGEMELRVIMTELGVGISGRFNKIKAIVAIRAALEKKVSSEMAAEEAAEEDGPEEKVEEAEGVSSLDGMSKAELIAEAESRGAEVFKSWSKEKIIEAIENA
jgi:hypothetical protein